MGKNGNLQKLISRFTVFRPEFLNPTGGVKQFLFAGIKRMTLGTNFNLYFRNGCPGFETVAAGAAHFAGIIFGVYVFLHGILSTSCTAQVPMLAYGVLKQNN
jgi:hypothetical protein